MIGILMANGSHDRHLVRRLGQIWHRLAEVDARHTGWNGFELPTNLFWRIRLRIKGLVMRGTAIQPDEDGIHLIWAGFPLKLCSLRPQPQNIRECQSSDCSKA